MNARKSLVIFITQILGLVLGIISTKIVLSVLGPEEYGIFGFAFSLCGLFFIFGDLGLGQVYFKRIAEGHNIKKHFSTFMSMKIVLAFIVILAFSLYIFYAHFISHLMDTKVFIVSWIIFSSYISDVYMLGLVTIYNARREVRKSQLISLIVAMFNLLYVATFVYITHSLYVFALSLVFRSLLTTLALYYFVRGEISLFKFEFDKKIVRDYMHFIIPLLPATLLGVLYIRSDPLILKIFLPYTDVGLFTAAQKFNNLILLLSGSLMTILYSSFSEHASLKEYRKIEEISNKATKYISIASTLISIFIFFNTNQFVMIFMSEKYLTAAPIIKIFMLQVMLMSVSRTFDSIMLAAEKLKFVSILGTTMYSLGICLNFILIPNELFGLRMFGLGAKGPAMKSLIIYAVSMLISSLYLRFKLGITVYWRFLFHVGAAFIAGFLIRSFPYISNLNVFYSFFVSFTFFTIIYFIILIFIREITKEDLFYFLHVLGIKEIKA